MPYDAELADRVRAGLSQRDHVREVAMFGGLAFMVEDRMVVCVSAGGGALLVRVGTDQDAELVARPGARRAEMGQGRSMGEGWIAVDEEALQSADDLTSWLDVALAFHAEGSGQTTRKRTRE